MKTLLQSVLFFGVLCASPISAQETLNFSDLLEKSDVLIEGEVIFQSYVKPDNEPAVYTINKVVVYQTLFSKKNVKVDTINVLTNGGVIDGLEYEVSHGRKLHIGEYFIGFVKKFDQGWKSDYYSFLSNRDGIYKLNINGNNISVQSREVDSFKTLSELIKKNLIKPDFRLNNPKAIRAIHNDDSGCLNFKYDINIISFSPFQANVIVRIKTDQLKLLTKVVVDLDYGNTLLENIYENGIVSIEPIGITTLGSYNSSIYDLSSNILRLIVEAQEVEVGDLFVSGDFYTDLVQLNINSSQTFLPDFLINENTSLGLSRYLDEIDLLEKQFDCVRFEGDIQGGGGCQPNITGAFLLPLPGQPEAAAGVDLILVIEGTCFGDNQGFNGRVEFTNDDGLIEEWCVPHYEDYIGWNDQGISVLVPSSTRAFPEWGYNNDGVACTGHIRVNTGVTGMEQFDVALSPNPINLELAWRNRHTTNPDLSIPLNHSQPAQLVDYTLDEEFSGYYFYYGPSFPDQYKPAFERALNSWRCEGTHVNWEIKSIEDLTLSGQVPLAIQVFGVNGIPGGALATTSTTLSVCSNNDGNESARYFGSGLNIRFDLNVSWYIEEDQDFPLLENMFDFESVALHELGHLHGLRHVNNPQDIMYYGIGQEYKRLITPGAINGGNHILDQSINSSVFGLESTCNVEDHDYYDCFANSISENRSLLELYAYPTSSNNIITVVFPDDYQRREIFIYDSQGKLIATYDCVNNQDIFVSNLTRGIYVIMSRGYSSIRFIKV